MLLGLGNDIVSVNRIKNSYKRFGKRLEKRIYTTSEIKLIWKRGSPCFKTLSSRWAAKEAFVKALGTGFSKGIFWKDISVVENIMGILGNLDGKGLLGLVGVWVLYHIFNKK